MLTMMVEGRLFARLKDLQIEGEVDGFVQRVAGDLGINQSIADPPLTHFNCTNPHRTYFHHLTIVLTYKDYLVSSLSAITLYDQTCHFQR